MNATIVVKMSAQLSDGGLRNGYTVKILNKLHEKRTFQLSTEGLDDARLAIVGLDGSNPEIDVVTDNLRALKVHVTVPRDERDDLDGASTPFQFVVTDLGDGSKTYHEATFLGPNHD